jgi:tRNA(Ile)-lysidine synthase
LAFSKDQIRTYLNVKHIQWREDDSNKKDLYRRNQIRHQVLPFLERWNPNLSQNLARLAEVARAEDEFLESLLPFLERKLKSDRKPGRYACQSEPFLQMPLALQRRWIRRVCEEFSVLARGFSFERVEMVLRTWSGQAKGPQDLGFGLSARREGSNLILNYQKLPPKGPLR